MGCSVVRACTRHSGVSICKGRSEQWSGARKRNGVPFPAPVRYLPLRGRRSDLPVCKLAAHLLGWPLDVSSGCPNGLADVSRRRWPFDVLSEVMFLLRVTLRISGDSMQVVGGLPHSRSSVAHCGDRAVAFWLAGAFHASSEARLSAGCEADRTGAAA